MNFKYRARASDGEIIEGYVEGDDQRSALNSLKNRGLIVINLNAQSQGSRSGKGKSSLKSILNMDLGAIFSNGKVPLKTLMIFFRQLATMENAGLSLSASMDVIAGG